MEQRTYDAYVLILIFCAGFGGKMGQVGDEGSAVSKPNQNLINMLIYN